MNELNKNIKNNSTIKISNLFLKIEFLVKFFFLYWKEKKIEGGNSTLAPENIYSLKQQIKKRLLQTKQDIIFHGTNFYIFTDISRW